MRVRWRSLEWRFPLLIVALVLGTSAIFLWSAYTRLVGVLLDGGRARLSTSATLVAGMLGGGTQVARQRITARAADSTIVGFFGRRPDTVAVIGSLQRTVARGDTMVVRVRLLDLAGRTRFEHRMLPDTSLAAWADSAIGRGFVGPADVTLSPILDGGATAQYELIAPVRATRGVGAVFGDPIGWLVETRIVRASGVESVLGLAGTRILLVGEPGTGVWTDLATVAPGPPRFLRADTSFVFPDSPRGPGVGAASPIPGTPWVVWLQLTRAEALAPMTPWVRRLAPVAIAVVVLSALLGWVASRRITRRLATLSRAMDRVELDGVADAEGALASADEIMRLEASFQRLAARLRSHQQLEARLQQAQRLEAVGRLAGGIAHDFNNVLTVVSNYGEIVRANLPPTSQEARDIEEVLRAADRAARLTRQLLTFSRREFITAQRLDLNDVIADAQRMLERLIPENVTFQQDLDRTIGPVLADAGQIEQVLLNLAINASDAMPQGGELSIRTAHARLDELPAGVSAIELNSDAGPARPAASDYVGLIVRDTGTGMDRETLGRIFEPFFTTKPLGKGTGLGLATVHGIVTRAGGRIWVYSEPGQGTTFKIYFPASDGVPEPLRTRVARTAVRQLGVGTLLLVEDDTAARIVTRRLLTRGGYKVHEAADGGAALAVLRAIAPSIDLVLSDVMMPGIGGLELAKRLREEFPAMPVVLMSGYNDADLERLQEIGPLPLLLEKPFSADALLDAVRDALEAKRGAATDAPPGSGAPPAAPP